MVLPLKRWKSRTPPGIVAGGLCKGYNPFTMSKGRPHHRGDPFSRLQLLAERDGFIAGWSSPVARQAHNLKVVGSNPTPATKLFNHLDAKSYAPRNVVSALGP